MNDLVFLFNGEAMTDSLSIAEHFQKRHDHVLRSIENVRNNLPKNGVVKIIPEIYTDAKGEQRKLYKLNEKAFALIVMGFTGKKALEWKLKYIDAFDLMRRMIEERLTIEWNEARSYSKITRKVETDMIKRLVEYAQNSGSKNANRYYVIFTKLANKFASISNRDTASIQQLNNLSLGESIILHTIEKGLIEEKDYHDIYKECKERLDAVSELAFISDYNKYNQLEKKNA